MSTNIDILYLTSLINVELHIKHMLTQYNKVVLYAKGGKSVRIRRFDCFELYLPENEYDPIVSKIIQVYDQTDKVLLWLDSRKHLPHRINCDIMLSLVTDRMPVTTLVNQINSIECNKICFICDTERSAMNCCYLRCLLSFDTFPIGLQNASLSLSNSQKSASIIRGFGQSVSEILPADGLLLFHEHTILDKHHNEILAWWKQQKSILDGSTVLSVLKTNNRSVIYKAKMFDIYLSIK
jgi:hypothetical protein